MITYSDQRAFRMNSHSASNTNILHLISWQFLKTSKQMCFTDETTSDIPFRTVRLKVKKGRSLISLSITKHK